MLLNLLSHYLQNQATQTQSAPRVQGDLNTNDQGISSGSDQYQPSPRAILISAIASEFDVTSLSSQDINRLQDRIQQYGLLNQHDLKIFGKLHASGDEAENSPPEAINALDHINQLSSNESQDLPYRSRKALARVQTLIHNLASATPSTISH